MNKTVAIVIPYYKNELAPSEQVSLKQCLAVLGAYDIYLVSPNSLNVNLEVSNQMKIQRFDDEFFHGVRGYNKLMLSESFYQRFKTYDYILIYQLDAYVFRDELQDWANKGYDYIGGPRIHNLYSTSKFGAFALRVKRYLSTMGGNWKKKRKYVMYNNVGNGGFSLRRVKRMIYITHKYKDKIACQLNDEEDYYPEDWWLMYELRENDTLKKPSFKEALAFAFDVRPQLAFKLNGHQFPFGCHAFSKPRESKFWTAYIHYAPNDILANT